MAQSNESLARQLLFRLRQADEFYAGVVLDWREMINEVLPIDNLSIKDVVAPFSFLVNQVTYIGHMTAPQYDFLKGYTDNIDNFVKGLALILTNLNAKGLGAMVSIMQGLDKPAVPTQSNRAKAVVFETLEIIPVGEQGCCTIGGQKYDGLTETYCITGLGGTNWTAGTCSGIETP
jgi:hypothetical protein